MTITLDFQVWLDWLIALPIWIKIASAIVLWPTVALIIHRAGGPYNNNDELEGMACFAGLWPVILFMVVLFSPVLILWGLFNIFGGKIKPKS